MGDLPDWMMRVHARASRPGADLRDPALTAAQTMQRPRPMPRQMRPAAARVNDPNSGVRRQAAREMEMRQAFNPQQEAYAPPRNQFAEAGGMALEATGLPSIRRGTANVARGAMNADPMQGLQQTGAGAFELGMGGLGVAGWGVGARGARPAPRTNVYHIVDAHRTEAMRPGRYGAAVHFDLDPAITTHLGDFGTTKAARFDYRLNGRFATPEQFRASVEATGTPEAAQQALSRQGFIGVRENEYVAVWDRGSIGRAQPMGPLAPFSTRRRAAPAQVTPEPMPRMTPPPREIAPNGMTIRPPAPFRQSFVGGSEDLADAADLNKLPRLTTPSLREDWADANIRNNRGYEFRGPQDTRYGLTIENTPDGAQIALENRTPDASQYGRVNEFSAGEARSIFRRAMAAMEKDMATNARPEYRLAIPPNLRPQHRRIFEAMAERQVRGNGWPGYRLERARDGYLRLTRDAPESRPPGGALHTGGERLNWLGNDRLIRNPTEADLTRLSELGDEMKYVMDTDGNVYAFSAADAHHNTAMRALRDNGVQVRSLGPGAEVTDPDAAGFIWRNKDGSFAHENANMVESGPYSNFAQRVRPNGQATRAPGIAPQQAPPRTSPRLFPSPNTPRTRPQAPAGTRDMQPRGVFSDAPDVVAGESIFRREFTVDGKPYRANIGPLPDGGGNVTFDQVGNPRGLFAATGGHSVTQARDVFRNVEQAIRDDIANGGRPYYEIFGVPEKLAVYRQIARRAEVPPGYAWDQSDPEALILRRAPNAPVRANRP